MARRDVKGAKQFNYEIDAALVDAFRAFCKGRNEAVKEHLEMALQRHMENPPPPFKPAAPPLPPIPAPAEPTAEEKPAKKGKK
ncbi:hypothetical protein [Frigoriglobus tundricola]|uniref:Uncharacterized protein n=1 Tax=Frigoriglobus tundricola TaxID=2774151 RepID=A0A6M5Z262_9BACT|nr:hypothetical protein [Frigoriglobus tundricola]QJX00299.1 hypothetical protein FTUN_7924 [Frigoriglobus tundricola]